MWPGHTSSEPSVRRARELNRDFRRGKHFRESSLSVAPPSTRSPLPVAPHLLALSSASPSSLILEAGRDGKLCRRAGARPQSQSRIHIFLNASWTSSRNGNEWWSYSRETLHTHIRHLTYFSAFT
ncbi:Uncharacterized protein FKW44_019370 [Caligus rogercresseyi]|uniref:Uncharacterized protein n=1 Tax=Caligus rogercresseyi TaxID=217165 RepID=A0A7T8JXC8_CALRO|nr:Uncharacterized protein FKW44_019370 [Caligus rogercresseyi]